MAEVPEVAPEVASRGALMQSLNAVNNKVLNAVNKNDIF